MVKITHPASMTPDSSREDTMAYRVLRAHAVNQDPGRMMIRFDAMASHDITYVGVIQTARASGLDAFPLPYVLTNCHNSLCAVGGTINADDHAFGFSAAKRYGGEYVPAHMAVIHQYMRERYAAAGQMILASDSHTRYGALGTLAVGEGGPELVKQLLGRTYELTPPPVWAVRLTGAPRPGVGPQDVALALIAAVFPKGLVKNCVLEFIGDGIANLDMDFRMGVDVMTTETTCLSSIWRTDETVRGWLALHGRPEAYQKLSPGENAYYDGVVDIDLSKVEPMIALPFHPSNAFPIREFSQNAGDILRETEREAAALWGLKDAPNLTNYIENGRLRVQQGFIGGCAGGLYANIRAAASIIERGQLGSGLFELSVYPSSQPMMLALTRDGTVARLIEAGAVIRTAFCGPCFGAGDVPVNKGLSIRHATRNFPNREGSKPGSGQSAFVALMDARSIAATAANGGLLTSALELPGFTETRSVYRFDDTPYRQRVFSAVGKPDKNAALCFGPGIADWPEQIALPEIISLTVTAVLTDAVTTTDELIPSGETSSFRSNPEHLAEFTLSRRAPDYVKNCKRVRDLEISRRKNGGDVGMGSVIVARKPGDGSAREQAASCQRVLGGLANIASEYATRRYRSNLINWGILPFVIDDFDAVPWETGATLRIDGIRRAVADGKEIVPAIYTGADGQETAITLRLPALSADERDILLAGCLINFYRNK